MLLRLPVFLAQLEPVLEGTEQVLGETALRFRLTFDDPEGAFWKGLVWVTADGIVLKGEVTSTMARPGSSCASSARRWSRGRHRPT